jgi:hypothetical protein
MFTTIKLRATRSLQLRIGATLMKLRRGTRRIVKLQAAQFLRLRMETTCVQRRQPGLRKKGKADCFTELRCLANKA